MLGPNPQNLVNTLCGKGDFAEVINGLRLSWIQEGPTYSHNSLKAENILHLESEICSRKGNQRGTLPPVAGGETTWKTWKWMWIDVGAKTGPRLTARKEMETSVPQLEKTEWSQQPEMSWEADHPHGLQKGPQPSLHLDFSLVTNTEDPTNRTTQSQDFWPTELWDSKWVAYSC